MTRTRIRSLRSLADSTFRSRSGDARWAAPLSAALCGAAASLAGTVGAAMAVAVMAGGVAATPCLAGCLAGTLADELTADRLGLERDWIVQVPFDSAGHSVSRVTLTDDLVIVQTGDGGVHAIAANDGGDGNPCRGALLWSHPIDTAGQPVPPVGIGRDLVVASGGRHVYGLERSSGRVRWQHGLKGSPIGAAVAVGDWVYQPQGATTILRLPANPRGQSPSYATAAAADRAAAKAAAATAASGGRGAGTSAKKRLKETRGKDDGTSAEALAPLTIKAGGTLELDPLVFGDGLMWITREGLLVALEEDPAGWQRNEFSLNSAPAGPAAIRGAAVFVTTAAGDLARIDSLAQGGGGLRLAWHVRLDHRPDDGPFLADGLVIVSLGEAGMRAYSVETGELAWETCLPGTIVAVCAGRIWYFDKAQRLASLDAATGAPHAPTCLGGFTVAVQSRIADRLILASPDGAIVSLSPRGSAAARRDAAARHALPPPAEPAPAPATDPSPFDTPPEAEPADEAMEEGNDAPAATEEQDPFAAPGDA
ncbi:MAG: PQQ-binding-like beta-propeller repeat protein [Planctomycetaceae bacterium]